VSRRQHLPTLEDPVRLTLALCHEVGNFLAAARLSAHLIGRETDPSRIRADAEDIDTVASQAGAIVAHLRPLLTDAPASRFHVDPREILAAVERAVTQPAPRGPLLDLRSQGDLPDLRVDADALHHLIVTLVLGAWEASPPDGRVRVAAEVDEGELVFAVTDTGRPYDAETPDARVGPRGRGLVLDVAATLVGRWGGGVYVETGEAGTRVELRLPVA
jgi:signal transduction histidine kinase